MAHKLSNRIVRCKY